MHRLRASNVYQEPGCCCEHINLGGALRLGMIVILLVSRYRIVVGIHQFSSFAMIGIT